MLLCLTIYLALSMSITSSLFGQKVEPEDNFWKWFTRNESMLFAFESDQENIFDKLAAELQKVHPDLTFEFGPEQNGIREFVISAGGIKGAFPFVEKLAESAPTLPRWTFIKFRPRRAKLSVIQFQEASIDPKDVAFTIEPDGGKIGITLFIGSETEFDQKKHGQIGYLILDEALGEYDVEMFAGFIEFKPRETFSYLPKQPVTQLAAEFDRMLKRLSH
jgi:hypothetical protein